MSNSIDLAITVASAFGGTAIAAVGVAWKLRGWLGEQFSATRKSFFDAMTAHEAKDQSRHEDNLERFSGIRIALARHGIENGDARSHSRQ